ncbi:serine protease [Myxococcota bacterium]|nr:serine protease [Myxococcota bacterium]
MMVGGCGLLAARPASGQDEAEKEWDILTAIREVDVGLDRVYPDPSDTWFYDSLPDGIETPEEFTEGALTWRYDGQELFRDAPVDEGEREYTVPDLVLTGMDPDPDSNFGVGRATRVDLYGRRWLLDHVDYDVALAMREEYDREAEAAFGDAEGDRAVAAWETPEDAGRSYMLSPTAWSKYVCSDGTIHRLDLDGAELEPIPAPMAAAARKVLLLALEGHSCSGTMVDDEWMLTAAHCVTAAPLSQVWCTLENLDENTSGIYEAECSTWSARTTSAEWAEAFPLDGPQDSDYAVVKLITPPTDVGYMFVTGAADSEYEEEPDYLRGYPRSELDCSNSMITDNSLTTVDTFATPGDSLDLHGRHQHLAEGTISEMGSTYIEFTTSTGRGASGGPHYWCPTGSCALYQAITAVQAYHGASGCTGSANPYTCSWGASWGPKGSAIRDWVITNTP